MSEYKIIFKGEITNESNRPKIELALAKFFKIPSEKASGLFNGKSYALKKGLTLNSAEQMQTKFKSIGVVTHLIKEDSVTEGISSQVPVELTRENAEITKPICKDCGSSNISMAQLPNQSIVSRITTDIANIEKVEHIRNSFDKRRIYAFLFSWYYSASQGALKQPSILALLLGWNILFYFLVGVYFAFKQNSVKSNRSTTIDWKKVAIVFGCHLISFLISILVFNTIGELLGLSGEMTEYGELHDF